MASSQSRRGSAISTSSAVRGSRGSSPSPSASPVSPTSEGLSRRLSWNRPRENADSLTVQDVQHSVSVSLTPPMRSLASLAALAPPSQTQLIHEGSDLGAGWSSSLMQPEEQDWDRHPQRPFIHNLGSETSFESVSVGANDSPNEFSSDADNDQQHLTSGSNTPFNRPAPRVYDVDGIARSGPSRFAASVGRSPTLRKVSSTLRKASIRVVNIMGQDHEHRMERIRDEDDEESHHKDEVELNGRGMGLGHSLPPYRPAARPPEDGLRGRTLCIFTARSRVRRAMAKVLRNPWVETAILLLIITNVVVLAIQASAPLNEPRIDDGYFQSWEDYVLLALFIIFTIEMFARIVTTGLILDPETSVREFLFAPAGVIPRVEKHLHANRDTVQRTPSKLGGPSKAAWRTTGSGPGSRTSSSQTQPSAKMSTLIAEAPFQKAVAKQQSLSAAGRPYLRHSWHRIDMIAVVSFWITFILAITGSEASASRHIYIFRALSVLRAGRLLVITSGTTTILHSLKSAGPLLITVAYFVIFAAVLFSIIGVQSFRGSFRRDCVLTDPNNASNSISLSQQCGGYLDPTTLTEMTYIQINGVPVAGSPKGFICPVNQVCQTTDQNPDGDSESFDNVLLALVQVIVIASINTWSPVMYQAMDSDFFSSSLYWIVGVIVINFWLINLIIAVVVNTFINIRGETKKSAFGADDTRISAETLWTAGEKKQRKNIILKAYEKTELFWVFLILADLVAQACKTAGSSEQVLDLLKNLELAFTFAFDVEMIIRIAGYFPDWRAFFSRPRNSFDLFLAVVTSIIQIPVISSATVYPWLTIFQLLRWYRVILAFPRMKPLLLTVFGSFAGLLNMVIFLFLMNFIGALVAVQLFRGDLEADQLISFSQTYNSFLGMYQIFSSENWTTVLYAAMTSELAYVQGWLAAIFLCGWFLFSNFIVLQMFIANFQVAEEQKRKHQIDAFIRKTEPQSAHVSWIDRLNPYRLMSAHPNAVKVQTLPPNLVLPLKQNIGADVGGLPASATEPLTPGTKGALRRLLGLEKEGSDIPLRNMNRRSAKIEDLDDDFDNRGLTDLLPPLNAGPSEDEHLDAMRERRNQQADFIAAHPSFDQSLWIFKQSNPFRKFCQACFDPAYGDRIFGRPAQPILRLVVKTIIFCAIVASIVVAAIATPLYRKNYYEVHGIIRTSWFDLTEVAIGMVFVIEAVMKIVADGFIFAPNAYLLSIWNIIDFAILITLIVNTVTSLIFIGGLSRFTRALRAFRTLRLITLFSRLRDTLHVVLFAGFLKIVDASILVILYLIPFAVWGLNIFSGLLYSCNDTSVTGKADCVGEFLNSPVDNSLNFITPRVWSNPGLAESTTVWAFDSFRQSILILFEIVSLEGWIDVMNAAVSIVAIDIQSQQNYSQWNSIFFLIFNLFGAVIILTLFVSIIIQNFSVRSGMALLTVEQRQWVDLLKFIKAQTPSQLPKHRPEFGLRSWCYRRATEKHGWWARGFTFIYYVHILLLAFQDFQQNIITDVQLDWIFLGLTILYAIDLLVRFYGLGFNSFRSNGWNLFDLVVITGSFATTIPALQAASSGGLTNEVNTQLQKLFLVSISLKLVQRVSSLNQLFKASVAAIPAIGNLFLLWAILFLFYAIMYIEVFGLTKQGNNAGSRFMNYYSLGNALLMLSFMSTGEGWNGYMHDYTISAPRCTSATNFLWSDCGSPAWAYALFLSWNILSMYIFLNMFTGVVVESFAYVYQMPGGASLNREDMRAFKRVWAEFDTGRTGYIKRRDLIKFFSRLTGVFEVRLYPTEFSVPNIVRACIPDPVENASGKILVATGVKRAVDVRRVENQLAQIDFDRVRERRQLFSRLYNEARISEEPGRGISFTAMLILLTHYKLIDDEKALQLDELLVRRARTERVTDLVNLDRVRGLLRTVYWRRRFLASRDVKRRTLNAEAEGIPAIVLEPTPATPSHDFSNPFEASQPDHSYPYAQTPSPPRPSSSPSQSPESRSIPLYPTETGTGMTAAATSAGRSPSLSIGTGVQPRRSLARQPSTSSSMLSSEDAHRRDSTVEEALPEGYFEDLEASVWGDMMREAVDHEEE